MLFPHIKTQLLGINEPPQPIGSTNANQKCKQIAITCYKLKRATHFTHRQIQQGMVLSFLKIQLTQPSIRWIHKDQGGNLLCM